MTVEANDGKQLVTEVDGVRYERIPIKTRLVVDGDDISQIVTEFAAPLVQAGDVLFVTEKIVAIAQGRAYPIDSVTPRPLARWLSQRVTKTPAGIGLGMPETMEMALQECGVPRIVFAAGVAAITKLFGRRGDFYRIAGTQARGIDGPTSGTIPPYNHYVVLAPAKPDAVARELRELLGGRAEVVIVDMNDLGGDIIGSTVSASVTKRIRSVLLDNPLGQGHQSTPMGIIRPAS
ncbi:F420-0:gamma-glutamyl ligase [Homoserinimonas aerilata]|uniref:F420-0:gamma-glutamyl ligase n=1 Tax=Homoserinimonas aerilata TaxID=1162970 RepID=A0A542YIW6_9MICO|nr:coenzyme F420-0:L-glutamate ligase [Homoserinimonas aerilata]TQL47914.1 F420-0:gamma-glutamyl ligase [Homoserinimonas aerilata]